MPLTQEQINAQIERAKAVLAQSQAEGNKPFAGSSYEAGLTLPSMEETRTDAMTLPNEKTQTSGLLTFKDAMNKAMTLATEERNKIALETASPYYGKMDASSFGDILNMLNTASNKYVSASGIDELFATKEEKHSPAYIEFQDAVNSGYKGSFLDYQNEDANRKRSIAAAGVSGLTPSQINTTVNSIASAFDNEPLVKEFNTANTSLNAIKKIGTKTKSPTDDMAFIYAFAKIMDPNSVVREGEYKTVQDYGQALTQKYALGTKRIFDNSNFLTEDAKTKMLTTLESKLSSLKQSYKNTESEYQRQIDDAYAGKARTITKYEVENAQPTSQETLKTLYADPKYKGFLDTLGNAFPNATADEIVAKLKARGIIQ
jgi:hypothetical protein